MHSRLVPLVAGIEARRAELLAAVAGRPVTVLEAKPDPAVWSPAEIIEHLAVVESGSARLLSRRLLRAKEAGLGMETSTEPVRSTMFDVDLTKKLDAPEIVRPTPNVSAADALAHFAASREALHTTLAEADGYDLSGVMARHERFGELNMYDWLVFLERHEQRHLTQLKRVLGA